MLKRLVATTAIVVLFAAGCGDDDPGSTTTETQPTEPDTDTTDAGEPTSDEATIEVTELSFPDVVEVTAGGTVTWVNTTTLPHTVTSTGGPMDFDEPLDGAATISITFDEPGSYEYGCTIHPSMSGTVVVS